jgi:multiple sugar transport system permease protein
VGFAAPLLVYLLAFYAFPLYRNIELSLHDYNLRAFVQGDAEFVGLANYADIIASDTFVPALRNTVMFVLVSIVFQYTIGLALAVFFRQNFRLSGVLRALFLQAFGIGQIIWLTSPGMALVSVTIANIWLGIPFNLVILYSGLQNIPGDLYEAASLDGATGWQQFRRITFPLLRPVSAITILLGLIYTLKVVDIIWVMTTGGPGDASTTLAIWSYREAFGTGQPDFSPAAAVGNLLILIALAFGFAYLHLQRRQEQS